MNSIDYSAKVTVYIFSLAKFRGRYSSAGAVGSDPVDPCPLGQ